MANLDPLKFYIAIQNEDAIGKLNELQEKFNSLKSQTIKVNVEGLNELRELLKVLNQNKSNIGENVAGNADKMTSALKKSGDELKKQESSLVRISDALGRVRSSLSGSSEGVPFLDGISRVGERNIQTLIKEQGHIERLIAIAKKSIDFGEGHPVLGMGRLRGDQMSNLQDLENIKKAINNILYAANQGEQAMIRFLNTSGSLRTTPFSKDLMGNDITLLGGHFDKLTHSVTGTASAMRNLEKEMRLDSNAWPKAEMETNLRRYNQMLADAENLLRRIDAAGSKGFSLGLDTSLSRIGSRDISAFIDKALKFQDVGNFRALNELIGQFQRLKSLFGEVATEQEKMNNKHIAIGEKADAQYMREVEEYTKRSIQEYNKWQESIRQAGIEIANLKIKIKELEEIRRNGQNAGVGTSQLVKQLPQLRQSLTVLEQIHKGERKYGTAKEYISSEEYQTRITLAKQEAAAIVNGIKAKAKAAAEQEKSDNEAIHRLQTIETSQRRYNNALEEMQRLLSRLSNADAVGQRLGLNTDKARDAFQQLQQQIDKTLNFDTRNFGDRHAVSELIANWNALKKSLTDVASEQEKVNAATDKANRKAQETTTKQAQKDNEQWAESMRRAEVEATKLEIQLRKLREAEAKGSSAGVDTSKLQQQIALLEQYLNTLRQIQNGSKGFGHTNDLLKDAGFQNASLRAREEAQAVAKSTMEKERNANATQQLLSEEQRLAQAMNQTTQAAHGQSQVMSDLKSMAMQYLGVWGGQQFINNIIQIGGQLEMQRLSIGAILQDTAHANELFEKIKGLATQSPFGVVQLDQMTKQLTAYGFKYNELYDMTKRLADISAATGTGVDRLALALGHVRSEAALSGYTLRQFSMANVPLLAKLSDKLGKTTKEIRDMVRKKEIGYEDVVGVLKDLTNEGGMFYNMQEVISESVKAKFKNVKDAMDIMYGEMAEGAPGDALKEVANVLMELTRGWKDVATVLGTTAAVWGIHRAGILAVNAALGQNTAAVSANILSYKKKRATELQNEALTRKLTAEELALVATRKKITAENVRVALSTNAMTKGEALRLVGLRKLSLEEAKALIRSGEFTAAEVRMAMQGRVLGMNLGYAGNMMRYFAASAKMAMAALLSNPWTWAMAGITAAVELWQRNSRELERTKELNDDIYNRSQEGLKNTRLMMQNTGIRVDWKKDEKDEWSDVTGTFGQHFGGIERFVKPEFDKNKDIDGTIDEWMQYIRDYAATPNRIINAAMSYMEKVRDDDGAEREITKVRERREQYDLLYESVIKVSQAQEQMQSLGDAMEFSTNETNGGWFNEDLLTNIGDYDEQLKKVSQNIGKTYADLRSHIDKTIRKAQKEDQNFAKATKGMDNYAQAFEHLVKNHNQFSKADEIFKDASFGVSSAYKSLLDGKLFNSGTMSGLDDAKKIIDDDLNQFFTSLDSQLRTKKGWNIDEVLAGKLTLSEDKQQALLSSWKDVLAKVPRLTDETARELTQQFAERYHIQIDAETENAIVKLSQLEQSLNNLVNGDYKVNVDTMTNAKSVFDQLKKDYKAAKEYVEQSKPILAKFGISITGKSIGITKIDDIVNGISDKGVAEEVRKVLVGYDEAIAQLNKAQEGANNLGLKLDDDKKGKKKSGSTKAYKDEFAKRWDERIRIMKEAYDWYDKWEKKVGNDEAIKETNAKYADIFKEWRTDKLLPMDFDVNEIADYTRYVEKIRDDALKRYQAQKNDKGKNNGQEALRVYRQAVALLNDVKFDNFAKAAEDFKSIIDQTIEDLNERWDIFDTVRNATGDLSVASRIAGFGDMEANARTSADAMRNQLKSLLRDAGGENLLNAIPLDVKIDEESLRKQFEQAIPQTGDVERYKEKIDGLIKAYQEWQKLQRKVTKDDVSVYANLIGSVVSYDAQIKKLQDKLEKQKGSNNALAAAGIISRGAADNANDIAQTQFDWEKMKLSADYANVYNNAIAMSRTEFSDATDAIERMLQKLRELGLISADDYVSEREKLNKARNEWSTTGFLGERGAVGQFISGGYEGLMNYYAERRDKARQQEKNAKKGSEEQKRYAKEAEHYGKLFDKMSKLSDAAKDVITAFQTLQAGLDLVGGMLDSLGMEGAANAVGDASGVLGSGLQGASALSALGPYGQAAGAGIGLISGLAQVHDKGLERQIVKLRDDVKSIESNTALILQARERTLGFDTGDLRRSYASDYQSNNSAIWDRLVRRFVPDSKAQSDMLEYYQRNSSGTGYEQEYKNLIDQRKDYMKILDAQESKKKKSQSDIDETKEKIAELDDQIRHFTQDLAKELFDIDIKGWADQLSDALASAFENGEDMAKAYRGTVTNILQQVMNKMMQMAILEPMFKKLQDKLFGNAEKGTSGVFDPSDPQGSMGKVTSVITDFFGKGGEGEKTITAATEFMAAIQRGVQNAGLTVLNESSGTLSSGVKGMTEETSDLLAGYVNALRQDVSINRILLNQFVAEYWPSYMEEFKKSVKSINNIDNNTRTIMEMMQNGNGAMYEQIASLRQRFDNVVNGIENLSVR